MNRLLTRVSNGALIMKNTRFFSSAPVFEKFAAMPSLDMFIQGEVNKTLLIPVEKVEHTVTAPSEVIDEHTLACVENFHTASLLDEVEGLYCTSVLRKRRTKMNKHKLKKRRRRERFSTRKSTTS